MGVDIIVKDAINDNEIITFDQTLSQLGFSITDFRHYGMKWYFYDLNDKYHTDELRIQSVSATDLMIGACEIINDVSKELSMDLPNNPIEAYQQLKEIIDENLETLDQIITKLQSYYECKNVHGAWKYLNKVAKQKDQPDLSYQIETVIRYVELAVFFHVCGSNGHSIEWSY